MERGKMEDLLKRIVSDPKVMSGKPFIRGTKVPVDIIVRRISDGQTIQQIQEDYPSITKKDVQAALAYSDGLVGVGIRLKKPKAHAQMVERARTQ